MTAITSPVNAMNEPIDTNGYGLFITPLSLLLSNDSRNKK
jgi:hypothetical protein